MNHTFQQRNIDFMKAVRRAYAEWDAPQPPTVDQLIKKVLDGRAPRFYVSFETAYKTLTYIDRNGLPKNINNLRKQMWVDLASRVVEYMTRHPSCNRARALIEIIENQDAPSFYITEPTARSLYYRITSLTAATTQQHAA